MLGVQCNAQPVHHGAEGTVASEAKSCCETGEDHLCDLGSSKINCFEICFHSRNSAGRRRNIRWVFYLLGI